MFFTFIPLPKKTDLKRCENYRTVPLVSHTSKIFLRIILVGIRVKTKTEIADEQARFRQGRGGSKNTDAQGTQASATTVLRGLQEGVRLYLS